MILYEKTRNPVERIGHNFRTCREHPHLQSLLIFRGAHIRSTLTFLCIFNATQSDLFCSLRVKHQGKIQRRARCLPGVIIRCCTDSTTAQDNIATGKAAFERGGQEFTVVRKDFYPG